MGTRGYFAYRHERTYYRQYLPRDAYPDGRGRGRRIFDMIPRNPSRSDLEAWIDDTIEMLETTETFERFDLEENDFGYQVTHDNDWIYHFNIEWTYVIDLDNLVLTVNGFDHWRLDSLPYDLEDYYVPEGLKREIPGHYLRTEVDLWPAPGFDIEERQQEYEALHPVAVPVSGWGAPTWDELSVSQRFSIEITNHLLDETSARFAHAYVPFIQYCIAQFCWDVLCASIPGLPIFRKPDFEALQLSPKTLSSGFNNDRTCPAYHRMQSLQAGEPFKAVDSKSAEYFWVRACLVTFCVRLNEPIYIAHEVEQMVRRMRHDGSCESVGIILSSQQELVVVAVDKTDVRHSPVLDIRVTEERPGGASDGRLLLAHLLSPPLSVTPLPWRSFKSPRSSPASSNSTWDLPLEIIRLIVYYSDIGTYLALCRVLRLVRSACIANPRIGDYTVLHRVPDSETIFTARSVDDNVEKTIELWWERVESAYPEDGKWEVEEVSLEEPAEQEQESDE